MKTHISTKWIVMTALFLAVLSAVIIGCSKQGEQAPVQSQSSGQTQALKTVYAAYVPAGYYLPFLVVEHEKLLEKRGYKMELERFQDNSQMINLFINGQLDVTAQSSFSMFPIEVEHPSLFKFIYGQYANSYFFMVPSDSKVQSLQGLKGLTIGTWKSPTAVNFITILLGNAGLQDQKDYQVQLYGATEWPSALENSVVPAVFGFDVPLARLAASGKYRYIDENALQHILNGQKVFNGGAFISTKLIQDDPQKAAAIRDALLGAIDIIQNNPKLTAQIVADTLLSPDDPLASRLQVASTTHFDEFAPPDETMIKSAQQTLNLLVDHKIVPKQFDTQSLFWIPASEKTNTPAP